MINQHIFRLVLAVLAIKSVDAKAKVRTDYNLQLAIESDSFFINTHIKELLEENGILIDEESEIIIHEEDTYINLSCFNCIINILPPNYMGESSYNEYRPGI